MNKFILLLSLILLSLFHTKAEIKLPALFGNNMLLQQNTEVAIWGWCDPDKTISLTPSWSSKTLTAKAGKDGKWIIKIQTPSASYNTYEISIHEGKSKINMTNVLIGEVWLCSGQSNMEMPMKGYKNQPVIDGNIDILKSKNKNIRLLTVKRNSQTTLQEDITGNWEEASTETVRDFSATAYHFGKLLNETLDIPVGLICSSWGGSCIEAWMNKEMLKDFANVEIPQENDSIKVPNRTPTTLFNAMINPLIGYGIKGCIWYQGESNYEDPAQYPQLFETMVKGWRNLWQTEDFPFYFCQIAPYDYASISPVEKHGGKYNSAFLREAQYQTALTIPNSGMAVLMDIGEELCIHPAHKKTGGERLALLALSKTYGMKGFAAESPVFKEMAVENEKTILSFENAPMWLTSFGKPLECFEVAGEDKVFYPAKAEIKRSKIEVTCDKVPHPVAVRYAFKDFIKGDLFSTEGLPISSFRTDNWEP